MATTPTGRKKKVSGEGNDVHKTGEGLGTGPVGSSGGYSGRPQGSDDNKEDRAGLAGSLLGSLLGGSTSSSGSSGSSGTSSGGLFSGKGLIIIAIIAFLLFGGGGNLLGNLFGSGSGQSNQTVDPVPVATTQNTILPTQGTPSNNTASYSSLGLSSLFGGLSDYSFSGSSTSSGWTSESNSSKLDTSVAPGSRAKRTTILGKGKDVVTIMVYMCGADLESKGGMATSDLKEMVSANLGENVNLVVLTGGCKSWHVNGISNTTNQIWLVKDGKLQQLESNAGNTAMTKPATLSSFIQYCKQRFPANRNALIFWDHGGGSLSGYGYDERFSNSGTMTLTGIKQALSDGGMTFDFIGFDTCLMATAETALVLADYADYMIASEETEPGIGWYYTEWLTKLGSNTSTSTLDLGKKIVDDFVTTCAKSCAGQSATLSVIDLAELETTLPADLKDFSTRTSAQISSDYKSVSNARSSAREFAASSRIDQVDLVSLANNLGTDEAKELAKTVLSAVKYNRTSSNMTNAYGLSIYFPYKKISNVDNAARTFKSLGIDDEYTKCIQAFASVETGGQAISGGSSSALSSLLSGYSSGGQTATSSDMITSILGGLLGGSNYNNVSGLSSLTSSFLGSAFGGKSLDRSAIEKYLGENRFDTSKLIWKLFEDNKYGIALTDEQWSLVQNLELNVFIKDEDGGYIDLGLDNVFSINEYGVLSGEYDYSWLAINGQFVAYYVMSTVTDGDHYTVTGRVPVLLNGKRAELILVFDNEHEDGYVAGARYIYSDEEGGMESKNIFNFSEFKVDEKAVDPSKIDFAEFFDEDADRETTLTIKFLCDYYNNKNEYQDSYQLGEEITVTVKNGVPDLTVSQLYFPEKTKAAAEPVYRITDIYNQQYWTPILPR